MSQSTSPIAYADDGYRAGVCNIGPAEVARRRSAAITAAVATAILAVALVMMGADPTTRLLIVFPLAGTFVTVQQARSRFCVGYAMSGRRNFGALGSTTAVEDDAARRADRARANRMILNAAVGSIFLAVLFSALPV